MQERKERCAHLPAVFTTARRAEIPTVYTILQGARKYQQYILYNKACGNTNSIYYTTRRAEIPTVYTIQQGVRTLKTQRGWEKVCSRKNLHTFLLHQELISTMSSATLMQLIFLRKSNLQFPNWNAKMWY